MLLSRSHRVRQETRDRRHPATLHPCSPRPAAGSFSRFCLGQRWGPLAVPCGVWTDAPRPAVGPAERYARHDRRRRRERRRGRRPHGLVMVNGGLRGAVRGSPQGGGGTDRRKARPGAVQHRLASRSTPARTRRSARAARRSSRTSIRSSISARRSTSTGRTGPTSRCRRRRCRIRPSTRRDADDRFRRGADRVRPPGAGAHRRRDLRVLSRRRTSWSPVTRCRWASTRSRITPPAAGSADCSRRTRRCSAWRTPRRASSPASGPIQTRADLQAQHDMLAAMMDRFPKMMKQGLGPEDIIAAAPTKELRREVGNPDLFVSTAYRSMWLHVRELGGVESDGSLSQRRSTLRLASSQRLFVWRSLRRSRVLR